ncbi:MAG: sulfatase, partial [Kocuria rhizophila]
MTPSEITFRHVPAGSITLKNARAGAVRDVVLQAFQLAETPVTVAQYAGEAGNSRADRPVTPITWFDAIRWCNAASDAEGLSPAYTIADDWAFWNPAADGYRLPTEAEWEFACRAGTTGPTYGPLSEIAWTEADGVDSPQPVATKQPNDFGLYDMLGNVWEWCWD